MSLMGISRPLKFGKVFRRNFGSAQEPETGGANLTRLESAGLVRDQL